MKKYKIEDVIKEIEGALPNTMGMSHSSLQMQLYGFRQSQKAGIKHIVFMDPALELATYANK